MIRRVSLILAVVIAFLPQAASGFTQDSGFAANPADGVGRMSFDLRLHIEIESERASGPLTLFVNSRDGSMAIDNAHVSLWALGMADIPGLQIHHAIIRQGELTVCGLHPGFGEGCLPMGAGYSSAFAWLAARTSAELFFASVMTIDQSTVPPGPSGTSGLAYLHGRTEGGGFATFWFDPGNATVPTQMPFLGPGVGVIKDYLAERNRVIRHARFDLSGLDAAVSMIDIRLINLSRQTTQVDLSRYHMVTAFTGTGLDEGIDIGRWIMQQGTGIRTIAREMEETCANGPEGTECRKSYRARIEAMENQIGENVFDYARRHGIPVPAELD